MDSSDQSEQRWFIESLARGLKIIRAFEIAPPNLTVSQLSARSGVSRAAARRVAMTLEALGYLGRTERNEYFLKPSILSLGNAYLTSHRVNEAVQPILSSLRDRSGRSSSLVVLDGHDIVYVARAWAAGPVRIHISRGDRLPAFATATGRVLAAGLSPQALDAWLRTCELNRFTEKTVIDVEELKRLIEEAIKVGYCIVDSELGTGIRSLAVPVANRDGGVVAALNITTQSLFDRDIDVVAEHLDDLKDAAAEISRVWHYMNVGSKEILKDIGAP